MDATEVLIKSDGVTINLKNEKVFVFSWDEFDDLELAFDVVRRLSGSIRDKRLLITIKDENK